MPRLLPCPSCGRHVRVTQPTCPFCGSARAPAPAPARLTVALLGLCLAACTTNPDAPSKPDKQAPETPPQTTAPEPAPEQAEPPIEPAGETGAAAETTGAEPAGETGSVGTDEGAAVEETPPIVDPKPKPKQKYGAPRPEKKYGAPPKPDF
jgi:hypothetical protein